MEKKNTKKFDLPACRQGREDRLIDFAIRISEVAESLLNTALGKYIN